jgi:hypothetical protein
VAACLHYLLERDEVATPEDYVERLLQQFEQAVSGRDGNTYRVYLYGRSRPADTWKGWLVFERITDGARFATDVETTQPNAEAVLYWATGLTDAYFDGALERAQKPPRPEPVAVVVPEPVVSESGDSVSRQRRLAAIEQAVLACFTRHTTRRLLTRIVFDELPNAHADIVRALEDLEKQGGLLVRRTEEGNDWLFLTQPGAEVAGVQGVSGLATVVDREPPRPR